MLPEILWPCLVTELDTMIAMNAGRGPFGGFELLPGRLVQVWPQAGGVVVRLTANPLKLRGAGPPPGTFFLAHRAPQKVTWVPIAALVSAITKEPRVRKAPIQVTVTWLEVMVPAGLVVDAWRASVPTLALV